jgi:Lactate racemase N-terminal domain
LEDVQHSFDFTAEHPDETTGADKLPQFFRVRQHFASHRLDAVELSVNETLEKASLQKKVRPGQRVAIAVGSRGITNLARIVRAVVRFVEAVGGVPAIVPAMGSHGGATAAGQASLLASFGIDAESMKCPIESSMDTIQLGTTADGFPIYFDATCKQFDHVIVVNRIKPHTRLVGDYESGLVKMLMIGLGKHRGAVAYHQAFQDYDYRLDRIAPIVVPTILKTIPISLGLAIIEDAFDHTSLIEAVTPKEFLSREPELLKIARSRMPQLPFDHADLLIIDSIGKEISGTGMDTNVVGRKSNDNIAGPNEYPKVRQIYVRSLSSQTAGNATGIGIAEFCRTQVVRDMNVEVTRLNCLTSGHVTAAAIPIHFESDREVLTAAMTQVSRPQPELVKWMWVKDTLRLSEVACSAAYWTDAAHRDDLHVLEQPKSLEFDANGNLASPFANA